MWYLSISCHLEDGSSGRFDHRRKWYSTSSNATQYYWTDQPSDHKTRGGSRISKRGGPNLKYMYMCCGVQSIPANMHAKHAEAREVWEHALPGKI